MNCKYRILENAHIGTRVRLTPERGKTVPFKNGPMTGMKIEKCDKDGFSLSHPNLPKNIWVDFHQLPLDNILINHGIIESPITFVEEIASGGSAVLIRADTFDYLEMLQDKRDLESSKTYKIGDLNLGDRAISTTCKDSRVMIYLGTYYLATWYKTYSYKKSHSYYVRGQILKVHNSVNNENSVQRAFFIYEGTNTLENFALGNKTVNSFYKCGDREIVGVSEKWIDAEINKEMIRHFGMLNYNGHKITATKNFEVDKEKWKPIVSKLWNGSAPYFIWIQETQDQIFENCVSFLKTLDIGEVYSTIAEADEARILENRGY